MFTQKKKGLQIRTLLICLGILLLFSGFFVPESELTQIAYCYGQGGLVIRNSPNSDGERIGKINYLDSLKVSSDFTNHTEDDKMVVDGFKSHWVKVNYKDTVGYVFSGFLLPFNLQSLQPDTLENIEEGMEEGYREYLKISYNNILFYEYSAYYEGGTDKYTIPNFTFQEGFLFLREYLRMTRSGEKNVDFLRMGTKNAYDQHVGSNLPQKPMNLNLMNNEDSSQEEGVEVNVIPNERIYVHFIDGCVSELLLEYDKANQSITIDDFSGC